MNAVEKKIKQTIDNKNKNRKFKPVLNQVEYIPKKRYKFAQIDYIPQGEGGSEQLSFTYDITVEYLDEFSQSGFSVSSDGFSIVNLARVDFENTSNFTGELEYDLSGQFLKFNWLDYTSSSSATEISEVYFTITVNGVVLFDDTITEFIRTSFNEEQYFLYELPSETIESIVCELQVYDAGS